MTTPLILSTSPRKGGNCDDAGRLICEAAGIPSFVALRDYDIKPSSRLFGPEK